MSHQETVETNQAMRGPSRCPQCDRPLIACKCPPGGSSGDASGNSDEKQSRTEEQTKALEQPETAPVSKASQWTLIPETPGISGATTAPVLTPRAHDLVQALIAWLQKATDNQKLVLIAWLQKTTNNPTFPNKFWAEYSADAAIKPTAQEILERYTAYYKILNESQQQALCEAVAVAMRPQFRAAANDNTAAFDRFLLGTMAQGLQLLSTNIYAFFAAGLTKESKASVVEETAPNYTFSS